MRTLGIIIGILIFSGGALALSVSMSHPENAVDDPVFYNELGYMLMQDGDSAGAIGAFRAAISLDPTYENARKNLYVAAFQDGQYELAASHACTLADAHARAQYSFDCAQSLVAWTRNDAQDVTLAIAALERAITYLDAAGDYPHAAENKAIVEQVLAEAQ